MSVQDPPANLASGLVPIFATPFATLPLAVPPGLNAALAALFLARATADLRDPARSPSPETYASRDTLLDWPDPPVQALKAELLAALSGTVAAVNLYSDAQFDELRMQARGWFTILRPNGALPVASHPMTAWCAQYCVAAPEPVPTRVDSAALRLYETRLASSYLDASTWRLQPMFNPGHHMWRPTPGWLAVFPSAQPYEIALNRGATPLVLVTVTARFSHPTQDAVPA